MLPDSPSIPGDKSGGKWDIWVLIFTEQRPSYRPENYKYKQLPRAAYHLSDAHVRHILIRKICFCSEKGYLCSILFILHVLGTIFALNELITLIYTHFVVTNKTKCNFSIIDTKMVFYLDVPPKAIHRKSRNGQSCLAFRWLISSELPPSEAW